MDLPLGATLPLAFVLGMGHALDADHIAAVAALSGDARGLRRAVWRGVAWGLGHTLTIAAAGGAVLALRVGVPERATLVLELLVGIVLVALGGRTLMIALRASAHTHEHVHDGVRHVHWHVHVPRGGAEETPGHGSHEHGHTRGDTVRAILVGGLHGLAGSAGAALLALTTVPTLAGGVAYLLLFGAGSIAGMALVSLALGAPLAIARRRYPPLARLLGAAAGIACVLVGAMLAWGAGTARGLFA